MAQNMDFRNAFNGFNKEDVVRYLEYLQNKHTAQIAELRNELAQAEQDQAFIQETKEELEQLRQSQYVFQPRRSEADCAEDYRQWRRAVERARSWIENEL